MRDDDFDQFSEALTAALEVYDKRTSALTIEIWWEALKQYDLSAVLGAFSRHIQNPDKGQFVPKPADIVRLVDGGTEDRALQAWSKVDQAIRTVGPYQTVVFDDAFIHASIRDMGGWIKMCNVGGDEYPFLRNEFVKRYRGIVESKNLEFPEKLIGISEQSNAEAGRKIAPPLLLGNPESAKQIYRSGGANRAISSQKMPKLELKRVSGG